MEICEKRSSVLAHVGHILVEGGPGAGKTTLALLKAQAISREGQLKPNQKILFLSFARATITRIEEQAKALISAADKSSLEINTYHGFSWYILKSFGYLLGSHRTLKLITPPDFTAETAELNENQVEEHKDFLFNEKGVVCFDIFASKVYELLKRSGRICSMLSDKFPFVIVDEFQDTDTYEWKIIQLLGKRSSIIALADLDQRIFEFRGASVTRIPEFIKYFQVYRVDLGKDNHRSTDTDIVQFGDDILTGNNKGKKYNQVDIVRYPFYKGHDPLDHLFYSLVKAVKRKKVAKGSRAWSLAILVKTKGDTLKISSFLANKKVPHEVLLDREGPSIAATVIAKVMEPINDNVFQELVNGICYHIKGRKGFKMSKKDKSIAQFLNDHQPGDKVRAKSLQGLIAGIEAIVEQRKGIIFTGTPEKDWITVRSLFQNAEHSTLKDVYLDARFLRLLNRGTILSEGLSQSWRDYQTYQHASTLVRNALMQEHFSMTNRSYSGIFVMNVHKSKGKEFDEVLIWDEKYSPMVNGDPKRIDQDKIVLRVAVTRARQRTTFLTPAYSPSIVL